MSAWRLIWNTLLYHARANGAVALGVAAATAVLVGALLVGDSVRGSLRALSLDRLGKIDEILVSDRFFAVDRIAELRGDEAVQRYYGDLAGAIILPLVTVDRSGQRSGRVLLVGCDDAFWQLGRDADRPRQRPGEGQIVLNDTLAADLGAKVGDAVTLRLPKSEQVPADSPLAKKTDRIRSLVGLEVIEIVPTRGLGQFDLRPSQSLPRNAFVATSTLQRALQQEGKVNAILVGGRSLDQPAGQEASAALSAALRPSLADMGVRVQPIRREFKADENSSTVVFDYLSVITERLLFSPEAANAIRRAVEPSGGQPVLTYLVNGMRKCDSEGRPASSGRLVPYSTVSAIDFTASFPLTDVSGNAIPPLGEDEVVLNDWAARELEAAVGDTIRIDYFEPETTHAETVERPAELVVRAITPLTEPAQPFRRKLPAVFDKAPTLANDPELTPEVTGVTDQDTIEDWDAPFPFEYQRVRPPDDEYWKNHRTTPKAFLSLATGQRLWQSRFGEVTSFRVPTAELDQPALEQNLLTQLTAVKARLGFEFRPIKRLQLEASRGTTPFDILFLSLSFFVIAAALLLVAVLFRLGIEQRLSELGILVAVGSRRAQIRRWLLVEGSLVAMAGAAIGVLIGVGYAKLMIAGLQTWWLGAVTTPFLGFFATPQSLIIGYGLGVAVSLGTIAWSVRLLRHLSARSLLAGRTSETPVVTAGQQRRASCGAIVALVGALGLAGGAPLLGGMAQAGTFVGAGVLLLTSAMLAIWIRLRSSGRHGNQAVVRSPVLGWLAVRNAGRNPGRSAATIGLIASASFLIVAMSSFRMAPSGSGMGGFDLLGESSEPLFVDLSQSEQRAEALGPQAELLATGAAFSLRLRPGDDASCNNLYQATQPRVLGITQPFIDYFDRSDVPRFGWAGSAADNPADAANPWRLLANAGEPSETVPVVVDKNTAMYSLHLYRGIGEEFTLTYDADQAIRFRVVGLLENSVLQGSLIVGEQQFERHFPGISGYRYFLVRSPSENRDAVVRHLEEQFGDQGLDLVPSDQVLEQLLAVQNTYLSTFQSLGTLGLLLGTFGLAAVQMRNVLERRRELALLQATGFSRRRLAGMVMWENVLLLAGGLGTGVLTALLAVLPHKWLGEAAFPAALLRDLLLMLASVFLVGLLSSWLAVRSTLRVPLLSGLRGE